MVTGYATLTLAAESDGATENAGVENAARAKM